MERQQMIFPIKAEHTISAKFDQPRPLKGVHTHIHGAIDVAAPVGTPIYAPEAGSMFCYIAYREREKKRWPEYPVIHGSPFTYANYFYDTYGGIIILQVHNTGDIKRTHIIAHLYGNQILNLMFKDEYSTYIEEKKNCRFPIHAIYTKKIEVGTGQKIGFIGNAGYSTGPHIHYEIHPGGNWHKHKERINPLEVLDV